MVHRTIQGTFRSTNLTNESTAYLAKREELRLGPHSPAFAARTGLWIPRVAINQSQLKLVVEVALRSAKLIQAVMS
jgi:hypothetical protein